MLILIPVSHESGQVQRWPVITISILALNVLLYIITFFAVPAADRAFFEQQQKLFKFIAAHPEVEIAESTLEKMSPEIKQKIKALKSYNALLQASSPSGEKDNEESDEDIQELEQSQNQTEMNSIVLELQKRFDNIFYRKYGYIPSQGSFFTIISSIFLHGGIFHLLFNMLFLWLTGGNIEELWGRILFPIFYIAGGFVATWTHVFMYPQSHVPLIGASGAIAALMGAFMIRYYKTRINFVYVLFYFRLQRGRFAAPAYIMLPLWLMQQLWEAMQAGQGSGVAFWAHIGGFVFGAIIASIMKQSGIEEKYIAPVLNKKTNLVDENLSSGMEKLEQNDLDGAVQDLRQVLLKNPEDPIAHNQLAKAYYRQGKIRVALLEFKRSVDYFIKKDNMEAAADEYVEMVSELPEMILPYPCQMRIAQTLEDLERPEEASLAYKQIYDHSRNEGEKENLQEPLAALERFADLCLNDLNRPQKAFKALQFLLKTGNNLSNEDKNRLKEKIVSAKTVCKKEALASASLKQKALNVPLKQKKLKKPVVEIEKKIKIVQPLKGPGKYTINMVGPLTANKVLPATDSLDLKRPSEPPVLFKTIYAVLVFRIENTPGTVVFADIFTAGRTRPYRIDTTKIAFARFLQKPSTNANENFQRLIRYIIMQTDSVYLDRETALFLKTGKIRIFPDQGEVESYEKSIWKQLMGEVRASCARCFKVYWIDGRKIPESGAKTKCRSCSHPMFIKPLVKT